MKRLFLLLVFFPFLAFADTVFVDGPCPKVTVPALVCSEVQTAYVACMQNDFGIKVKALGCTADPVAVGTTLYFQQIPSGADKSWPVTSIEVSTGLDTPSAEQARTSDLLFIGILALSMFAGFSAGYKG